ncbi:MAG: AtpZ/AtpI family protein [Lachnospiraceae bacterium]|nr:AtpZ/AtpI family protein [Lachnospiraceae bacterium]
MLVPILICSFLGLYIDKKLGTSFVFVLLFFVGAIAGGRNVFVLARKFYSKPAESRDITGAHISDGYNESYDGVTDIQQKDRTDYDADGNDDED